MNPLIRIKDYLEASFLGWQLAYHGAVYETLRRNPENLERATQKYEGLIRRRVRSHQIDPSVIDARETFYLKRFRNWLERKL